MAPDSRNALRRANRRGVLAMSAGMAAFVINDSLVKLVSQSLPGPQLIMLRGLLASMLLLAICHAMGALRQARSLLNRRVLARAAIDAAATLMYLTSLFHLPIGNAVAITMAAPLFIALLAMLLLSERVGPARWLAIGAGFAGVLLIVRPAGPGFNAYALLCLLATALHAGRDLMTRMIDARIPSLLITLATAVAVTLFAGTWAAFDAWQPVDGRELGLLGAAALFLSSAYYLVIVAMRGGEMSLIAPFRYSGLLFALLLGWLLWREVPDLLAWCGIGLLVAAGWHMLRRERRPSRAGLDALAD